MKEFERAHLEGPSLYYGVTLSEVEQIVDSCIELRKLERTIRGDNSRLTWLFNRSADGFFPAQVFD
jgi:hypothetical protein